MRLIQVGLGTWGRSWVGVAREAEGIELAAVVDPSAEALRFFEGEEGLGLYGTLDEALGRTRCEGVLVVTPPGTHHGVAEQALEAGKHVLVEKPLDTTLSGARTLLESARRAGRILMVSQNYRFNAPFRAAQRLVDEGELGALVCVRISCRRDTRGLFPPEDFRYAMGHPYALDMAVHHLDLLRALTGLDVGRVYARSWPAPDSPFAHDPTVVALMDLTDGTPLFYEGDWVHRDHRETSWNGEWEIVGEGGRLTWAGPKEDRNAGEVLFEKWGEPPRAVEQPRLPYLERAAVLQAMRDAMTSGEEPETSAEDNIHTLAAVLGLVASIEGGEAVDVAGPWDAGDGSGRKEG